MDVSNTIEINEIKSLRQSALIAGLAVLVMALTVPVVEFYIFPKLIDYKNAAITFSNITHHPSLFSSAVFIHFTTVVCDLVAAWALYIFLKPVNKNLAVLTAWFRIINAAFTIAALVNLLHVLTYIQSSNKHISIPHGQIEETVLFYIRSFHLQWRFMLVFFGIYMLLLGYLVLKSSYIPKMMGICLIISGIGYMADDLKYFFYPTVDTGFLWFTYFGELIFMFWLLFKGARIKTIKIQKSVEHQSE